MDTGVRRTRHERNAIASSNAIASAIRRRQVLASITRVRVIYTISLTFGDKSEGVCLWMV